MISPETRMMGLPCGDEIMIVGRTMRTQSTSVTDRRTDRRTDRITITDTVQTASHGKKTVAARFLAGFARCLMSADPSFYLAPAVVQSLIPSVLQIYLILIIFKIGQYFTK